MRLPLKHLAPGLAAMLLLAGCATQPPAAGPIVSQPSAPKGTRYACDGDRSFSAEYYPGGATLYITGQALKLKQVEAASGARYSDGAMTLWNKGTEVTLTFNEAPFYRNCRAVK
jgi:membrane-bound inhibitor of C-type lysozyme